MEVKCIGNTQIIHVEETGITQRTIGLLCKFDINHVLSFDLNTVKLGDEERFDKEQIGVKESISATKLSIYIIWIRNIWH